MNKSSKAFHRFRFNAMIQNAYDLAERKQNPKAMASAAGLYAKYNQLDKEDAFKIPWDEIIPQRFEPTSDPTVLGIKPIPNIQEKIKSLKERFFNDIEDISFENADFDEESLFSAPMEIDKV
jgi:hypothetical protein